MLDSLNDDQLEFIRGIEAYKNKRKKLFLSWTEVLAILSGLGYWKTGNAWVIRDDGPSGSRCREPDYYQVVSMTVTERTGGDWTPDITKATLFRDENHVRGITIDFQNVRKRDMEERGERGESGIGMHLVSPYPLPPNAEISGDDKSRAHVKSDS